jgi:hypothetical protein
VRRTGSPLRIAAHSTLVLRRSADPYSVDRPADQKSERATGIEPA